MMRLPRRYSKSMFCHRICALSALDPALTLRFAKITQKNKRKADLGGVKPPRSTLAKEGNATPIGQQVLLLISFFLIPPCLLAFVVLLGRPKQSAWKPSKRRGFAAIPIDTAMPQENQRPETRHVGASKRACRASNFDTL